MDLKSKIKNFFTIRLIIGLVMGSIGGFLFYCFVGCSSGSCAISSNPWISTIYGMMIGGLLFYKRKIKDDAKTNLHSQDDLNNSPH